MSLPRRIFVTAVLALVLAGVLHVLPEGGTPRFLARHRVPRRIRCVAGEAVRTFRMSEMGWEPEEGFRRVVPAGDGAPHYRDLGLPKDELRRKRYFVGRSLAFVVDVLTGTGPLALLGDLEMLPPEAGLRVPRAAVEVWDEERRSWWRLELGAPTRTREGVYFRRVDTGECGVVHEALLSVVEGMARGRFEPRPGGDPAGAHQP